MHEIYNTDNYPHYVLTDGNFSIWSNGAGCCASIPTPKAEKIGCLPTQFGDLFYVRMVKGTRLYR